ncbi:hypothetical protein AH446_000572 [Salmonella enterica subsp. enterica serovar Havana]|jgi:hypothetical protein|nr:hypothetical protein [Salmonella enterica subsp. enterica serovar Havana]EDR5373155.1 hypothetical protein [Salmonella enterica]EEH7176202.1 hypothetical protein [Salmonella enterica subsp. enterica]EDR0240823.1 hypothetical protein [Salmonella enterica subsp. enterica serovar Havana]EDR1463352.1 hypothetical protein [Salmonella enterica subsp. enterica serovar Havana]
MSGNGELHLPLHNSKGSAVLISPEVGWIFISWRTLTPGIDEAIQPS